MGSQSVEEHTIEIAGSPVFYRRAVQPAGGDPILYLHSVPTSSDDWLGALGAAGGVAIDLPGFGRSGKGGQFDYSVPFYVDFLERFVRMLELKRVAVIAHGWGAAFALLYALDHPDRITRLALVDPLPLLDGFGWPAPCRWWRRPLAGELLMGSINRWGLARALRHGSASPAAWAAERVDAIWRQFDQGTQRAILRLHRSWDTGELAAAGRRLPEITVPALIAWGEADPWLDVGFAEAYAERLPHAAVRRVPDAGHWPWLEDPALTAELTAFATTGGGA